MKTFLKELLTSVRATLVFALLLCGVFPLVIFGAGQLFFPRQANGSLIESGDRRILGLGTSRTKLPRREIFPPPTVGCRRQRLRRRQFQRFESGTNFPEADGRREATRRVVSRGERSGRGRACSGRRSHRERQRSRPPHQLEETRICKRRAWPENVGLISPPSRPPFPRRPIDAPWAFSVNPVSMFLGSTLNWTA